MKAYAHIMNDSYFCHKAVRVEVNIKAAVRPQRGDCFYLSEVKMSELEQRAEECYPYESNAYSAYELWKDKVHKRYNFSEAIYVTDVAFYPDAHGAYELHFVLGDLQDLRSSMI